MLTPLYRLKSGRLKKTYVVYNNIYLLIKANS